jgi:hypothetical protein
VGVISSESGDNDFLPIGDTIAIGILNEEEVRGIGDPDTTEADGDAAGDIESFEEDAGFVDGTIPIGIFEDADTIFSGTGLSSGVFE